MRLRARPSGPLRGRARPPGDKSISHRALLMGALASGDTEIDGLLEGDDVLRTVAAVQSFGAETQRLAPGRWRVRGRGAEGLSEPPGPLDFGNSGTGVRLTMGAAAAHPIVSFYVGDESLSQRPMARVVEPLARMGAAIIARADGRLPIAIRGAAAPEPITHESAAASAQVKSAVLLAGVRAHGVTSVIEPAASRDHTERMLEAFGAALDRTLLPDGRFRISLHGPSRLIGQHVAVPGDPSSAAFAAAAALATGATDLLIEDVGLNPLRAGFFDTLKEMGAGIDVLDEGRSSGELYGLLRIRPGAGLVGIRPPAARAPAMIDEYPILAALAAFAEGETRLEGAAELRVKESDRIALMAAGLRACGVEAEELPDGLIVKGCGPKGVRGGATIETHGDHRIAMAFLVLGLGAREPVEVDRADMIATSFPDFAGFMRALGGDVTEA